jgi:hypothetical protein
MITKSLRLNLKLAGVPADFCHHPRSGQFAPEPGTYIPVTSARHDSGSVEARSIAASDHHPARLLQISGTDECYMSEYILGWIDPH